MLLKNHQTTNKTAIIGAGASGLLAAIIAAKKDVSVTIYEKNAKIGRKLLATGNGRCNVTNKDLELSHFHGKNPSFAKSALQRFNYQKCSDFFMRLGVEMVEGERGRLYPMSLQASSIVDLLVYECQRVGVVFKLSCEVEETGKMGEKFFVKTADNRELYAKVLIASGSCAMPTLGSSQSGYKFARMFGHKIVKPFASLVQLVSDVPYLKQVSGVKFEGEITVLVDKKNKASAKGDILFTNYGVSGSAALDVSRVVSFALENSRNVEVILDLLPNFSKEQLVTLLQKRVKFADDKVPSFWLEGLVNKKLTALIIKETNLPKNVKFAKNLNRKDLIKIAYAMKNIKMHIADTKGFKSCEVAAGGVDTGEINPNTMESKLQKGLYFSGEVMDIDGDCGGYNLHWAWASGFAAGNALAD